jgi:hypothetical protein
MIGCTVNSTSYIGTKGQQLQRECCIREGAPRGEVELRKDHACREIRASTRKEAKSYIIYSSFLYLQPS